MICRCVLLALVCHKLGWGHHLAILAKGKIVAYQMTLGVTGACGLLVAWGLVHMGMGMFGIGLSFVLIYTIMTVERVVFAQYICGMSIRYWALHIVSPLCLTMLCAMVAGVLPIVSMPPCFTRVCVTSALSLFVLLGTSWRLVCNCEERVFLVNGFKRIRGRLFG